MGYCFGHLLQRTLDKKRLYTNMLLIGIGYGILAIFGLEAVNVDIVSMFLVDSLYYNANLVNHAFYLIAVLIMIPSCYFLSTAIKSGPVVSVISLLSSKVTVIYVIQWLLITCSLIIIGAAGIEVISKSWAFLVSAVILVLSAVFAVRYQKIRDRYRLSRK